MRFLKSVFYIINYKTLIVTSIALISTWICIQEELFAEFPLTIVGISIVFPIVFSINSAYRRRERALMALAEAMGHAKGIYLIARNQSKQENSEHLVHIRESLINVFRNLDSLLVNPPEQADENEERINDSINAVGSCFRKMREAGMAGRYVARMNQYLTMISVSIENMKVIYNYRTPRTLRAYSKVFIYSFPVLYAPYFANTAVDYEAHLSYIMPGLFSFILVSLDNIQEHLENPYDQIGEDDISVNKHEIERILS